MKRSIKPCPSGKERNPVSGRCRKARPPCPPGTERNPVSGRCRKACNARNPKTGKCVGSRKRSGKRTVAELEKMLSASIRRNVKFAARLSLCLSKTRKRPPAVRVLQGNLIRRAPRVVSVSKSPKAKSPKKVMLVVDEDEEEILAQLEKEAEARVAARENVKYDDWLEHLLKAHPVEPGAI